MTSSRARRAVPPPVPPVTDLGALVEDVVGRLRGTLRRVTVRVNGCTVEVEWNSASDGAEPATTGDRVVPLSVVPPSAASETPAAPVGAPAPTAVTSAVVGSFYGRPSPSAEPFVAVGDTVAVGQQVGLIETMKLFTPVLSEHDGEVAAVLVGDGEMVEFGQPLIELTV